MNSNLFEIEDLHASGDGTEILKGLNLVVNEGELHVIMGPNGSGKTTLASTLMASPSYVASKGRVRLRGEDLTDWPTDLRAKAGIFLAFQYPEEISGVSVIQFLRQAMSARKGTEVSALEVRFALMEWMDRLGMDPSFAQRHLNQGFSGGEKKRNEILQMALLEPEVAILDETDSGLDIDALNVVARGIEEVRKQKPTIGIVLVTHYQRILDLLSVDKVHIMIDGRIVETGGPELSQVLEAEGYAKWKI